MMQKSILLIISLIFIFSGCKDDSWRGSKEYDCSNCYSGKPETVPVNLKFSPLSSDKDYIYYTVYKGYAFTSGIYLQDSTVRSGVYVYLEPDQKYSVVAEYSRNGINNMVINECYPKTEYTKNDCDEECYYVFKTDCDLKFE